jgi:hypothetical protein
MLRQQFAFLAASAKDLDLHELISWLEFLIWNLEFSYSGAARDPQGLDLLPGVNPADTLGKGQHTGTTQPIENLLTASLVGDQTRMPEHRKVAGGGRGRTPGYRR